MSLYGNIWLIIALSIYDALAIFQQYRDSEAGDNNLWNRSGETRNRTLYLSLRKQKLNHYTTAALILEHIKSEILVNRMYNFAGI